jgi:hypothetical protein
VASGLAPKDPSQRRRYNQPARGEWVDLEPLTAPVLPPYPVVWYKRETKPFAVAKWMWDLWREDPVTSQWSPSDLAQALELGERYWRFRDAERLRVLTCLGLNAKGRRDLRWRLPEETQAQAHANQQAAEVRRLRIVKERDAGDDRL